MTIEIGTADILDNSQQGETTMANGGLKEGYRTNVCLSCWRRVRPGRKRTGAGRNFGRQNERTTNQCTTMADARSKRSISALLPSSCENPMLASGWGVRKSASFKISPLLRSLILSLVGWIKGSRKEEHGRTRDRD